MKIGIVGGTGPAGKGLALRLASVGYTVEIGSRSSGRASEIVEELNEIWRKFLKNEVLRMEIAEIAEKKKAEDQEVPLIPYVIPGVVYFCCLDIRIMHGSFCTICDTQNMYSIKSCLLEAWAKRLGELSKNPKWTGRTPESAQEDHASVAVLRFLHEHDMSRRVDDL